MLFGRTLTNAGTIVWTGTGDISLTGGGLLTNQVGALFDAQGDAVMSWCGCLTTPSFTNAGTFRKSAGTGITQIAVPSASSGAIQVQSGTLQVTGDSTNTGSIALSPGTMLEFASNTHFLNSGTTITGSGA